MCIETEHVESFHILRHQNYEEASQEGLVEAMAIKAINACNPVVPSPYEPICAGSIYTIFAERNQVARFVAFHGMESCSELVEVDLNFQGPDERTLGRGLKPKKRKRVCIEEAEYAALKKLADKVDYLEKILNEQMHLMGVKEEAYNLKSEPV